LPAVSFSISSLYIVPPRQIGMVKKEIISITAVTLPTTASKLLKRVNALFENLFCLYSP